MNVDIFIPVRLSSTRLPNKCMKNISGKSVLKLLIENLQFSKKIRNIIVCTTNMKSDDDLIKYLEKEKIMYFCGNEKDILVRYLDAAYKHNTDFIVSVDGDDIYTDAVHVDKIIDEYENSKSDYVGSKGFPHGYVPVGFKTEALKKICKLKIANNTETGYRNFFTETKLFKCTYIEPNKNFENLKNLRLSLDYQEDFELAIEIHKALGHNFHLEDISELFKRKPELFEITMKLEDRWKQHWSKNVADIILKI